jgi:aspartate/glutamate racemase
MSPRCSLYESMHCVGGARRWASCRSQSSCFAYNARPSPIVFNTNSAADPSEPKKVDASSWGCYPSGTIGVMGASSSSSLRFVDKFVCWSTRDREEAHPFVICNDPLIKTELLSAEAQLTFDCNIALGKLMQKRLFLEQSGACCIVMPCQFLQTWHDEISHDCSVPFLHIGDCVVKELKAAKLKPVEYGSNVRVGVLATDSMLATNCYPDKLESQVY